MQKKLSEFFGKLGQLPSFLLMFVCITVVSAAAAFFPVWVNLPVNVIIPIIILLKLKMVMFEKLKLSTLVVMRAMILLPVFSLMTGSLYVKIVLVFLIINILEATITDLKKNHQPYNFITGVALAASVLVLAGQWQPGIAGPFSAIYSADVTHAGRGIFNPNGIVVSATVCWIIAYTIWNWLFVIGEFSPSVGYLHIGILASPILSMLVFGNPGYWLVFRANSLTTGGIFQIACKDTVEKTLSNTKLALFIKVMKTRKMQIIFMIINLALIAYTFYAYFI